MPAKLKRFILRDKAIQTRAVHFIERLPIPTGKEPEDAKPVVFEISITEHKDKRTLEQNALYWVWMEELGLHLGYPAEAMHEYLRRVYLPKTVVDIGDHVVAVTKSTTDLKVKPMSKYLDDVQNFAAEQGCFLRAMAVDG